MENLGAMAYSRYTGFREITDRDVLELYCIHNGQPSEADILAIALDEVLFFQPKCVAIFLIIAVVFTPKSASQIT